MTRTQAWRIHGGAVKVFSSLGTDTLLTAHRGLPLATYRRVRTHPYCILPLNLKHSTVCMRHVTVLLFAFVSLIQYGTHFGPLHYGQIEQVNLRLNSNIN